MVRGQFGVELVLSDEFGKKSLFNLIRDYIDVRLWT